MHPREIKIGAVYDTERIAFRHQPVQNFDIMQLAVGDVDESRCAAAQIKQRVLLHRRLGAAEGRPREKRQAKIDGGRVMRIYRAVQFQFMVIIDVQVTGGVDQPLCEIRIDASVASPVGVGQGVPGHAARKPHVRQLVRLRPQAGLDVAQTLPTGELCERRAPILLRAAVISHFIS